MKLPCELVRDLLPLYHDNVCSEISQILVTEHLKTCSGCAKALKELELDMQTPRLETDEAKPLRDIRRRVQRKTIRTSLLIGAVLFLAALTAWFSLTQSSSVPIKAEEYTIRKVLQFENGMYYLEYSHPYSAISTAADIHRTEAGALHLVEKRPPLGWKQEDSTVRSYLIDPKRDTFHSDAAGKEVPFTAFYLGCPDEGEAVLLWSTDMDVPMATPEEEKQYLYTDVTNW